MSRPSVIINLNEEDVIALQKLANGMDSSLSLRAKIILESNRNSSSKDVASQLQIDQRSVSLWKKRYLENGIQGLQKTYGGGPQTPSLDSASLSLLLNRVKQSESWTVASLAQEFNVTPHTVSIALKKAGVELQRIHTWECKTSDNTVNKVFGVHALYLSCDTQAIVLRIHELSCGETIYLDQSDSGILQTRNRILASEVQHSSSPVSLANMVVAAGNHCGDSLHVRRMDLSSFLESVISSLSEEPGIEYHVYAHTQTRPVYRGVAAARIQYSNVAGTEEWEALTSAWLERLSSYAYRQSISALMCAIHDYLAKCRPSTEPFCWKKEGQSMQNYKNTDENAMIQRSTEHMLEQMNEAKSGTQVGAVLCIRDKNGLSVKEIISQEAMPAAENLDYSSPEALGRSLGKAELVIDRFVRNLAVELEQQYAEDAKKNEVQ